MDEFQFNCPTVETLSNKAKELQTGFDEMCKTLNNLVNDLESKWQGAGKIEFIAAYNDLRPKLKTISSALGKYETELKGTIPIVDALNKALSKTFTPI